MIIVNYKSFEGKRFSSLVFIRALPPTDKQTRWIEVLCDCGVTKLVDWNNLKSGKTKSCGCKQHREQWEGSYHPLMKTWGSIKQRCYNPNHKAYKYYGAKGVVMCKEWINDYPAFYKWCMENGWKEGLEIDKDIKGNGKLYSPATCKIVSHKENMSAMDSIRIDNKKVNEILNSTLSGRQLSKMIGISRNTISKIRKTVNE